MTIRSSKEETSAVDDLRQVLGDKHIQFDPMTRGLYSTDASNYQITPLGVCFPRHSDDVIAIHQIAARYNLPILPRGGGTSLAGQTVGQVVGADWLVRPGK